MKKIKILVDARVIEGEGQGSATYIKGMYNSLFEKYSYLYEIYLAGYHFEKLKAAFPFLDSDHFIPLHSRSTWQRLLMDFPAILQRHAFDYAHFQYVVPMRNKGRCKFILTIHDILFNDFPASFSFFYRTSRNILFRHALAKSEIVLTVSNYSKERIADYYRFDPQHIHITPNAIGQQYLHPYNALEVARRVDQKHGLRNYILYVSRIEPRKNHHLLLRAWRELGLWKRNIQLVCIGNDTFENPKFTAAIKTLQPEEKAMFCWKKYVSDDDLLELYQAARLFVYPSQAEGFGIPPIEAAALGIPTLCANSTAMQDFDFLGIHLFDPQRYAAFRDLLLRAINQPFPNEYWQKISSEVRQRYSWEVAAAVLHQQLQADQLRQAPKAASANTAAKHSHQA